MLYNENHLEKMNFIIEWSAYTEEEELIDAFLNSESIASDYDFSKGLGAKFSIYKKSIRCIDFLTTFPLFSEIPFFNSNNILIKLFFSCLIVYCLLPIEVKKIPKEFNDIIDIFEKEKLDYKFSHNEFYNLMRKNNIEDNLIETFLDFLVENSFLNKNHDGKFIVNRKWVKNIEIKFLD